MWSTYWNSLFYKMGEKSNNCKYFGFIIFLDYLEKEKELFVLPVVSFKSLSGVSNSLRFPRSRTRILSY